MNNTTRLFMDDEGTEFDHTEISFEDAEINGIKVNPVLLAVVIAFLVALLADSVTVHIVRRFKRLKNHLPNTYIYHISVLNITNFVVCAVFLAVDVYQKMQHLEKPSLVVRWLHLILDIVFSLLFAQFALMTIMVIDWYMCLMAPQRSAKFRKHSSAIIMSVYVYVVTVSLYSCVVTLSYGFPGFLSAILFLVNFLFSLILYLVFGVIYLCRRKTLQRPNANLLIIALIKMLPWLTLFINIFVAVINYSIAPLQYTVAVSLLLTILLPVFQLVLLYLLDQNYKAALLRIFDCRKNSQGEDIENSVDSVEEGAMVYSANNGAVTHRVNRT